MVSTHSHGHYQLPQKGPYKKILFLELQRMDHYIFEVIRPYEDGISFRGIVKTFIDVIPTVRPWQVFACPGYEDFGRYWLQKS